jgi:hypothetical protein
MHEVENFFVAHFQILGPLGCQGWVVIPQNVKKSQNQCTLPYTEVVHVYGTVIKLLKHLCFTVQNKLCIL